GRLPHAVTTRSAAPIARFQALVEASVDDALRPFLLDADKRIFAPDDLAGAVVYGRAGRVLVCVGDPIGPDGWAAFDRFVASARRHRLAIGLYQANEGALPELRRRGFRSVPIGLEGVVDLASFDLGGSRRANLRHTITRAVRGGIAVEWHPNGLGSRADDLLADIASLDGAWTELAGPSMGFTITRFRPERLRHAATA